MAKVPAEWIKGTGGYEINELSSQDSVLKHLDKGTKYLECNSSGTMAVQSSHAYGTWEFAFMHGGAASGKSISFITPNTVGGVNNNQYCIYSDGNLFLRLIRNGSTRMGTANNYIEEGTWYRIKITRTTDGEFTVYIKGGSFGNTYQLVDVTGGVGSNPVTDTTYSTSQYLVLDFDAGDKFTNLLMKRGVVQ